MPGFVSSCITMIKDEFYFFWCLFTEASEATGGEVTDHPPCMHVTIAVATVR